MSDLLTRAKEIKNATEIGENTAERVGGVMVDTVNAITSLQERAVNHEDTLTTHGKQIAALQNKGQNMEYDIEQQQGVIYSQGTRLTEVEHRADEHDTKIATINTDMKQMDDNILRHGEEIEDLQNEMDTKQQELTLTVLDNGNIRIGNLQGQTKDFMPATPSGDPMHYAYEAIGAVYNSGEDYIAASPWADLVDDADYNAKWGLNVIPSNATFVKTIRYNGADREVWQMKHPYMAFQIWVVATYASDGTKVWDDTVYVIRKGMWRMNGLGDLTNTDMRAILTDGRSSESRGSGAQNKGRTNMLSDSSLNIQFPESYMYANYKIEIYKRGNSQSVSNTLAFHGCYLRCIYSVSNYSLSWRVGIDMPFISAMKFDIKTNITAKIPNISAKSIITLLENTTATATITFPAELYNRLMDTSTALGTELVALLESKSNITFASL